MTNLLRLVAYLFVLLSFNAFAVDADGDGFYDESEVSFGTDPFDDQQSPFRQTIFSSDLNRFGSDVAIYNNTAVISGKGQNPLVDSPAVYIFTKVNDIWQFKQKIQPIFEPNSNFGFSIDIDDKTIVIGDPNLNKIYIYEENVFSTWQLDAEIEFSGTYDADFGKDVQVSGSLIAVGAPIYRDGLFGQEQGAVFIYLNDSVGWLEEALIQSSDKTLGDNFGRSLSLDDNLLAVGAPNSSIYGASYVFSRVSGAWSEIKKLMPNDENPLVSRPYSFGWSVILDDKDLFVGAPQIQNSVVIDKGYVYHYAQLVNLWPFNQKLVNTGDGIYGFSIALEDGILIIGLSNQKYDIFKKDSTQWELTNQITTDDTAFSFPKPVSISTDQDVVISSTNADSAEAEKVYIFNLNQIISTSENIPAMGGIGLLALGLSMLGLGTVRLRK